MKSIDQDTGGGAALVKTLRGLREPFDIQVLLDSLAYSADPFGRCPARSVADGKANCFDGALFAAAALRHLGHPPLVVDLQAFNDDDHVIAVFRTHGHVGAIAKSNYVGLRYREPVYRTLRELVMSYFEQYYNTKRERTLRSYSPTLNLTHFDSLDWPNNDAAVDVIGDKLNTMRHYPLLDPSVIAKLHLVDERSLSSGLVGANDAGLYRPK